MQIDEWNQTEGLYLSRRSSGRLTSLGLLLRTLSLLACLALLHRLAIMLPLLAILALLARLLSLLNAVRAHSGILVFLVFVVGHWTRRDGGCGEHVLLRGLGLCSSGTYRSHVVGDLFAFGLGILQECGGCAASGIDWLAEVDVLGIPLGWRVLVGTAILLFGVVSTGMS